MEQAREALKRYFGHEDFRHPQDSIVASILNRKNTLVIMPTGGGKSLCYQLPALLMEGVTLVVSPLIALMKDQVDALQARGIAAGMINSSQGWPEQRSVLGQMRSGALKLVYISPERFRAESFLSSLEGTPIAMLAIDEAHCISQWGHDFRPDYQRIGEALDKIGRPLCTAFTATATPEVREDIVQNLRLEKPEIFVAGFARPNLTFHVRKIERKVDKELRIRKLIERYRTGIIYCATRKSVEAVSAGLKIDSIPHVVYHAGMPASLRESAQNTFVTGQSPVAVATSAFGMGIDRADIRFVCHYEMPGSVEAFYQEAGRAGRDGKAAHCEMLFMYADKRIQEFFIEGANPDISLIRSVYQFVRSRVNKDMEMFLPVDEITEAMPGKINMMAVHTALGHLRKHGYIDRFDVPGKQMKGTKILQAGLHHNAIDLPEADLIEKKRRDDAKLKAIVQMAYARSCRQSWILEYFGESEIKDCGRCDECAKESNARSLSFDELATLQKALSGVARMSQRRSRYEWEPRYGKTRIQQCVLGSKDEKLLRAGLDQLSTYGILKDSGSKFVGLLFNAMEDAGLVELIDGEYPLLGLTEQGARVMYGEIEVLFEWPLTKMAGAKNQKSKQEQTATDTGLYQQLVRLRDRIRRDRGNVPAYTIFPNKVLAQLADLKPENVEAAMNIKGIGPAKAETILPAFLEVIASQNT
ncbi:RecQ family ATP-dependent DNA helicase [Rubellicoccus peritrichatus]|uniref:ATP-dependent DNA helicase RecQ n=1 Tax=Rubellicoccus peritrichatus TaxID=3080537 RepID=A0AAQ3QRL3_9BACT|nr:RecQ family ATP-dependent DNA helicase [Puniceicoccus sp. CR14]WOO39436.1 RecQ family ATP-dependent DNA helicase [Puniceicoccus sp. CR14]